MKKAVILFVGYIVCGSVAMANPTHRNYMDCPQYQFFDHGTEKCESCRDICDKAKYKGTEEQCWTDCKEYARMLWPEEPPATPLPSTSTPQDSSPSTPWHIAIAVSGVVILCLAAILVMYIKKNSYILRRPAHVDVSGEAISLNLLSPEPENVQEEENEAPDLPASMQTSGGATAVSEPVQVSDEQMGNEKPGYAILPDPRSLPTEEISSGPQEGAGAEQPRQPWEEPPSYRILPGPKSLTAGGTGLNRQDQAPRELFLTSHSPHHAPGPGSGGQEATSPMQDSMEGQGGSYELALPGTGSNLTPRMESRNTTDLGDDTEPKTPQSSIPDGAIGGEN